MREIAIIKCEKCGTLVRVTEENVIMPYKTKEYAYCPICGKIIYEHNSRGDFESEVVSMDETMEPYKSKNKK